MGFKPTELDRFRVIAGDLLVCEGGVAGRCAIYKGGKDPLMFQKAIHRVRVRSELIEAAFIQYAIRHFIDSGQVIPKRSQTTIEHLPLEKMKLLPIPLPPRREQRRIVAAIESNLSRVEAGVAGFNLARAKLKRYRAAVLKAACEGRLVPTEAELARDEGREYESADRLIDRVLHSSSVNKVNSPTGKGKKKLVALEGIGHIAKDHLPEGWTWTSLGTLIKSMKNGLYKPAESYTDEGGTACLRMYNIDRGRIVWTNVKRMTLSEVEKKDYLLEPGDLLVNRVNSRELVGKAAPIPSNLEPCVFESKNVRVRMVQELALSQLIAYNFEHKGRFYFNFNAQQVVGMASISQPQISSLPISLPPIAEQARIVAEVERRLSLIDELEAAITTNLKRADRLRQSILKRAFEGKLVPQDLSDEPAAVLLERIRRERNGSSALLPGL